MSFILKQNEEHIASSFSWNPKLFGDLTGTSYPAQVTQEYIWEQDGYWLGWVEDIIPEPEPETPEQITARLEAALDEYIDNQARLYRYESIRTMVTYVTDPNPKFAAEGKGAVDFRSHCYSLAIMIISEVEQGRPVPTAEELIAEMPSISDFIVY